MKISLSRAEVVFAYVHSKRTFTRIFYKSHAGSHHENGGDGICGPDLRVANAIPCGGTHDGYLNLEFMQQTWPELWWEASALFFTIQWAST